MADTKGMSGFGSGSSLPSSAITAAQAAAHGVFASKSDRDKGKRQPPHKQPGQEQPESERDADSVVTSAEATAAAADHPTPTVHQPLRPASADEHPHVDLQG